jgi:hypothetical protein
MIKMNDRKSVLELAARLLSWHTDNSESEIDETLRLSAVALREQADLIKELEAKYETAKSAYSDLLVNSMNEAGQDRVRIQKLEAQLTPETSDDHPCVEDDGCPTEGAVLKREWRRLTEQLKAVRERAESHRSAICSTWSEWDQGRQDGKNAVVTDVLAEVQESAK